jgi:hypothetical protein
LHLHTYFFTGKNMTKDKIIEMARQSGFDWSGKELTWENVICTEELEAFAKLVAQHEREACAKWLEDVVDSPNWADVIRARGQA